MPRVSVVMSVYNGENTIKSSIESILNQSFDDLELILINDGSTDKTSTMISTFRDQRITVLSHDKRCGIAHALNKGIDVAKGEYIARMDADDISHLDRFKLQVDFLDQNKDIAVLGSFYWKIDEKDRIWGYVPFFEKDADIKRHLSLEPREAVMAHPTIMMRSQALRDIGLYTSEFKLAQDKDLMIRFAQAGFGFANLSDVLLKRRKMRDEKNSGLSEAHELARQSVYKKNQIALEMLRTQFLTYPISSLSQSKDIYWIRGFSKLYLKLGQGLLRCNQTQLARTALKESLALNPHLKEAYLSWLQTIHPNLRSCFAIGIIQRVVRRGFSFNHKKNSTPVASQQKLNQERPLRIALVTNEFVTENENCSGLAQYIYRVSSALIGYGHDVSVITAMREEVGEQFKDGIPVYSVTKPKGRGLLDKILIRLGLFGFWTRLVFNWSVYRELKYRNRLQPFDVVQFTNVYASGLLSTIFLRIPYTVRISSDRQLWQQWSGTPWIEKKIGVWFEWLQIKLSRYAFVPSLATKDSLQSRFGFKHLEVIRTPVFIETQVRDESVRNLLRDRPYLLYFGGFKSSKGFHILAQALPQFLSQHPEAMAVLVGKDRVDEIQPSMSSYVESLCSSYKERLMILKPLPHSQLYPLIESCKLVVLPSLVDNLPNTCLEAMALGKPVVGTYRTSLDELLSDGETGFLAEPGDVNDLQIKIQKAWKSKDLESVGEAARKRAIDFGPEKVLPELIAHYKEVAGL